MDWEPGDIRFTCGRCGSGLITITDGQHFSGRAQKQCTCTQCGGTWALPMDDNVGKRSNSTLMHWRKRVLKRDNYTCQKCGAQSDVEAHHIIAVKDDPEGRYKYVLSNGITLCHACHVLIPVAPGVYRDYRQKPPAKRCDK